MGALLLGDAVRRYDYKPSPKGSVGSHPFAASLSQVPVKVSNRNLIVNIWNQANEGSCTGHGTAQVYRAALVHGGKPPQPPPKPSPQALYWLGRIVDGDPKDDAGSMPSSVLEGGATLGVPTDAAWPYVDGDLVPADRMCRILRAAADQKWVMGYARITSSGRQRVIDILTAAAAGHLVVGGTDVDQAFEDLTVGKVWPGVTGPMLGGHCIALGTAYDLNVSADVLAELPANWTLSDLFTFLGGYPAGSYVEFANSWDVDWCDAGFGRVSLKSLEAFDDLWIVSSAPTFTGTV